MAGKTINHAAVAEILGKAVKDPAYRARLTADPKKTLEQDGYDVHGDAEKFFRDVMNHPLHKAVGNLKTKGEHDPIERAGEI